MEDPKHGTTSREGSTGNVDCPITSLLPYNEDFHLYFL